ncbi:MAG: tagatose 1,6-diphosphate aldolase [Alphaproteobacteria bacterium]|nr:tagatose 1,6-diphosphate aldolase [Alphaproteobacteria bacterium]
MKLSAGKFWGLRRLATADGHFAMLAIDQRPPIEALVKARRGVASASFDDIVAVKVALARALAGQASALLMDPVYAYWAAVEHARPDRGLLLTLEDHRFAETPGGRRGAPIADWSVGKIKRLGADGVKLLVHYRPDAAPEIRRHQQDFVARAGAECREHDICLLLELLVYPLAGDTVQLTDPARRAALVIDSVREFADPRYGVDLFKLESPIAAADLPDPDAGGDAVERARAAFAALGAAATRPWVMLSAGAAMAQFARVLHYAYEAGASGYLAGRAIWWEAAQAFPDPIALDRRLRDEAAPYMDALNRLTAARAVPWMRHAAFAGAVALDGAGAGFAAGYGG